MKITPRLIHLNLYEICLNGSCLCCSWNPCAEVLLYQVLVHRFHPWWVHVLPVTVATMCKRQHEVSTALLHCWSVWSVMFTYCQMSMLSVCWWKAWHVTYLLYQHAKYMWSKVRFQACTDFILRLSCANFPGTNNLAMELSTLMALDRHGHGFPGVFFFSSRRTNLEVGQVLAAVKSELHKIFSDWEPSCLFTDNDGAQQEAFRWVNMYSPNKLTCMFATLHAV